MLPGIRFLFAAVVFAVSLVIFGLGAAALLRSAHEEFASLPARRVAPPPVFAQQPAETPPTLSMLRIDTPAPETVAPSTEPPITAVRDIPAAAPSVEAEKPSAPEMVAALSTPTVAAPEAPAPIEPPRPEAKSEAPEPSVTVAVASTSPIEPLPPPAPEMVPSTPTLPPIVESLASPQATATLTDADARLSSTKIATLGGPPVDTEPVPLPVAKPVIVPTKQVAKKPAARKRRMAARSVAPAVTVQTDPFGQPIGR